MELPDSAHEFLDQFETRLQQTLGASARQMGDDEVLLEASRHLALASAAKRMRPLLVDHIGRACELDVDQRLAIATTAELIHTASLLHDDVVDEATERRARTAANVRWNNSVAVLSGDLVLCIAFEQLHEFPRIVVDEAVELVATMTRAAMLEITARKSRNWDLDDWATVATGKTAALMAWCTATPAQARRNPELAQRLHDCGHHLGMAFQLMDDLSELHDGADGDFADLRTANPSYPVGLARNQSPAVARRLDAVWADGSPSDCELLELTEQIVDAGISDATVDRIDDHLDRALAALGPLADRPGGRRIGEWSAQLRSIARSSRTNTARETA